MKKILEITLWTLAFFAIYFPASYAIDYYFAQRIDFVAMTVIGLIFATVLVVCLLFNLPEKIRGKLSRKEEFLEIVDCVKVEEAPKIEGVNCEKNEENLY